MLKHADLPTVAPERNFVFCVDPLALTDIELETNFSSAGRLEFLRDLAQASLTLPIPSDDTQPITHSPSVRERVGNGE